MSVYLRTVLAVAIIINRDSSMRIILHDIVCYMEILWCTYVYSDHILTTLNFFPASQKTVSCACMMFAHFNLSIRFPIHAPQCNSR